MKNEDRPSQGERFRTNYDEKRRRAPAHAYPPSDEFVLMEHPGIAARLLIESALLRFEGFQLKDVEDFGLSTRDVVKYRPQLRAALLAMVKEGAGPFEATLRTGAVAYLGALELEEAREVLAGLATSPFESADVRSQAGLALRRLGAEVARPTLLDMLQDPHPVVRKTAVRALGPSDEAQDRELLSQHAAGETDVEVLRHLASVRGAPSVAAASRAADQRKKDSRPLVSSRARAIGRHRGTAPQLLIDCSGSGPRGHGAHGGRDLVSEENQRKIVRVQPPVGASYRQVGKGGSSVRLRYVTASSRQIPSIPAWRMDDHEFILDLDPRSLVPGRPLPVRPCDGGEGPVWVPGAPASPVLFEVATEDGPVWKGVEFALRVRFRSLEGDTAALLQLDVKMPMAPVRRLRLLVTDEELKAGVKVVKGFCSKATGSIHVAATLYEAEGGAAHVEAELFALPTNPISMLVYPQTTSTNGEGPAHYNGSEDRFYCYARCEIANGFPYTVTVGPNVTCRVTDGGQDVQTFSFTIGTVDIPANSTRNIYIYTWSGSGSDIYDVFEGFGDVRMDFTIGTSAGDITDWNVWAAMAQIRLALNFVGNISWDDMITFQDIVETEGSAILEQQSLYISETQIFEIPSTEPDWNRFRDLVMNDNKASDCTSGSNEANDLRDGWSSPTDWLDVWIVETLSGPACAATVTGFSPVDGPMNKGGDESGYIIRRVGRDFSSASGRQAVGRTVAHELGHFLGLRHVDDANNFMFGTNTTTNTAITHEQYRDMADHGFVTRFQF